MNYLPCPTVGTTSFNTILKDMLGKEPTQHIAEAVAYVEDVMLKRAGKEEYEHCAQLRDYITWLTQCVS
jgi:hypothetical protein